MWALLLQALTCVPHPAVAGSTAVLRAEHRGGAPVAGLVVTVEDRAAGTRIALPPTDARGETPWAPVATGLHVASASYRARPEDPPCLLLLAVQVPGPGYGTGARVAMAVAGVVVILLNVRALRRAALPVPAGAGTKPRAS
jgi:hypothetical protein